MGDYWLECPHVKIATWACGSICSEEADRGMCGSRLARSWFDGNMSWRASFCALDSVHAVTWEPLSFGVDIRRLGSREDNSRDAMSMVYATTLQPSTVINS